MEYHGPPHTHVSSTMTVDMNSTVIGYIPVIIDDTPWIYEVKTATGNTTIGRAGVYKHQKAKYSILDKDAVELFQRHHHSCELNLTKVKHLIQIKKEQFCTQSFFLSKSRAAQEFQALPLDWQSLVKMYDADGRKTHDYWYYRGKKQGSCVKYEKGIMIKQASYEDGKRSGPYNLFHPDGSKKLSCTYKNGKLNGVLHQWAPECDGGSSVRSAEYKMGLLVGKEVRHTEDGIFEYQRNDEGLLDGLQYKRWFEDGKAHCITRQFKNGKKEGNWTHTYGNSKKKLEEWRYQNDILRCHIKFDRDGSRLENREYNASGELSSGYGDEWKFSSRLNNRTIETWNRPDGTIIEKEWCGDIMNYYNVSVTNAAGQKIKTFSIDKKNRLQGTLCMYDDDGNEILKHSYLNGKRHGICYDFDIDGNLILSVTYLHGMKHGEYMDKRSKDAVITGHYSFGKKNGTFFTTDRLGRSCKQVFENDMMTGQSILCKDGNYVNIQTSFDAIKNYFK